MTEQTAALRPPFKVSGMATIKHLNVRKEGPDDEKILAVDVKLEIRGVDRSLCGYFDDALETFLWRGNTDALIQRNAFLYPVGYANEISGATVQIGSDTYLGCDVKKFSLDPRDGGVFNLTCSVAVYPTSADVSALAKLVQDDARVTIEAPPDLFASANDSPVAAASKLKTLLQKNDATATFIDGNGEVLPPLGDEQDPMYGMAVEVVIIQNKASTSLVQRHLKIGYNRAARLIEQMEVAGIVSASDSSGSRKVLTAAGVVA